MLRDDMSTPAIQPWRALSGAPSSAQCADHPDECATFYFEHYAPKVVAYLTAIGRSRDDAEEVMQEAFCYFFDELRARTAIAHPRAWIFAVARLRMLKRLAYKRRELPLQDAIATDPSVEYDRGPKADDEVLRRERHASLRRVWPTLSDMERECLVLRAQGLKLHEIGHVIGKKKQRVYEVITRTFDKFRE